MLFTTVGRSGRHGLSLVVRVSRKLFRSRKTRRGKGLRRHPAFPAAEATPLRIMRDDKMSQPPDRTKPLSQILFFVARRTRSRNKSKDAWLPPDEGVRDTTFPTSAGDRRPGV
jgi:hypothetical protein